MLGLIDVSFKLISPNRFVMISPSFVQTEHDGYATGAGEGACVGQPQRPGRSVARMRSQEKSKRGRSCTMLSTSPQVVLLPGAIGKVLSDAEAFASVSELEQRLQIWVKGGATGAGTNVPVVAA